MLDWSVEIVGLIAVFGSIAALVLGLAVFVSSRRFSSNRARAEKLTRWLMFVLLVGGFPPIVAGVYTLNSRAPLTIMSLFSDGALFISAIAIASDGFLERFGPQRRSRHLRATEVSGMICLILILIAGTLYGVTRQTEVPIDGNFLASGSLMVFSMSLVASFLAKLLSEFESEYPPTNS